MFNQSGLHAYRFVNAIVLFFVFLGHLCHTLKDFMLGRLTLSWFNIVKILYHSGAALVIPLSAIMILIGISLGLNVHQIFSTFHLQHKALPVSEDVLIQDIVPIVISLMLCVQAALNLITIRMKIAKQYQNPDKVILQYILPIIIGITLVSIMLFSYTTISVLISLYLTFHFILHYSSQDFLIYVQHNITLFILFLSISKTLLYCGIVSLTAGYYYYQIAIKHTSLRIAVSRILTRGSLWLTIVSVFWKIY